MKKICLPKSILTISILLCTIAYVSFIFNTNVWMDEAFTASLAHNSFMGVLYFSMKDTLPPLYNIILKLTTSIFGYTIPVMKLTSVVPMILTMILGSRVLIKRFNLTTAVSFVLSITAMPLMFYYGVEIRMYSLGFLFATLSGIYAYEVICESSRKNWILFTIFSVLAGYSHHFAFVTVGFVYLYLLIYYIIFDRKNTVRWFKCLGFTFLLYFPCMIVTLKQLGNVSGYFSMPDVTIPLFIQYATYPYMAGVLTASILCLVLVVICIILSMLHIIKKKEAFKDDIYSILCFSVYYGVLVFGTIVSKIMTANIFVDRYLFFATGLLWLFVAIQIGKLPAKINYIFIAVIIFIGICSYKVEFSIEYSESGDEEIAYLAENVSYGDIFYGLGGHEEMDNCIPFYSLLNDKHAPLSYVYPLDNALNTAASENRGIWVSTFEDYEPSAEELQLIEDYGYKLGEPVDFVFDRYRCKLYKLCK